MDQVGKNRMTINEGGIVISTKIDNGGRMLRVRVPLQLVLPHVRQRGHRAAPTAAPIAHTGRAMRPRA
jgi:hypothetical protein